MRSSLFFIAIAALVIWKYKMLLGMGVASANAIIGTGGSMFHFLAGFLLAYGIWELGILGLIIWGIVTALVENEHGGWAVFTLIASILSYTWLAKIHLLTVIKEHFWLTVLYVISYFFLGVLWALFKWALHIKKHLNDYNQAKEDYLQGINKTELTPDLVPGFKNALAGYSGSFRRRDSDVLSKAPKVKEHADDLVRWASFWPWSALWFLLNNPIRRAYESVFRLLHGTFQGISDRMFKGVEEELNPEVVDNEPPEPSPNVKFKKGA